MRTFVVTASLALIACQAPAFAQDKVNPVGEKRLAEMIEGRTAGPPARCLPSHMLDSSTIIDGTAIVYRRGSTLYVNRPRSGAESLDDADVLVTTLYGAQLCQTDKVDLVDRYSRIWNGFVLLGDFIPYKRVKSAER